MDIFKTKLSTDEQLKQESSKIQNIFQDTANQLIAVNSKIEAEVESKQSQIEALLASQKDLQDTQAKNEKLASKINSFLND